MSQSVERVDAELGKLNNKESPRPDNLLPRVLKLAAAPLVQVICRIFETSVHRRKFLKSCKMSKIIPAPKVTKRSGKAID